MHNYTYQFHNFFRPQFNAITPQDLSSTKEENVTATQMIPVTSNGQNRTLNTCATPPHSKVSTSKGQNTFSSNLIASHNPSFLQNGDSTPNTSSNPSSNPREISNNLRYVIWETISNI